MKISQCSKGNNSKSRQARVTVHKFRMSSYGALNLYEVSSKYLKRFSTYRPETSTCRNDYFLYLRCSKGRNSKGRLTRVMVLVF